MQKMVKGLIALVLIILVLCIEQSIADTTSSGATDLNQTNTSGTNTSISGGYSSETTYQSGSSSNTTNTTNNNSNTKTPVNPANAPAMSVYGTGGDSCSLVISGGISVMGLSFSGGGYVALDEACELRKKSKLLNKLGMKVAAISLMCQDDAVFDAMMNAGTPCPVDGLIGEQAKARWLEKRKEDLSNETSKRSMTWND